MNPGQLDRLVTLYAYSETRDANGGIVATWTEVSPQIWARRVDRGGREFRTSSQVSTASTANFTIRQLSTVTAKHRLVDAGITYEILNVQPVDRSGYQVLEATAINQ
jgi:SPP1 family predicted phage head-tail adaptor